MKIKLLKGRVALPIDIAALEQRIGEPLVTEFIEFVSGNDGAEPESCIFKIGETNESGINAFIAVKDIAKEMSLIESLPKRSFPIAWAEGGNYVFIDQSESGAVFFWDHEQPDKIARLADSLHSFLERLEPFDIRTFKLNPGQVKKAWIDPDFLKSIQS